MANDGLMQAASSTLGGIMGIATANWQDKRQRQQAQKLQDMQIAGQKQMGKFNQGLALDLWEKTNYAAQREQLEKAGLNVGLMYGSAGQGGSTQTPTGNVSGQNAQGGSGEIGLGMQLGMQNAMMKAQIDNMSADTEKKKVEAAKLAGIDTQAAQQGIEKAKVEIESILQGVRNAQLQEQIMQYDKEIKSIEANIKGKTEQDVINSIGYAASKLQGEMKSAVTQGKLDTTTYNEKFKQIGLATVEAQLRNGMLTAGIAKTEQETKNLEIVSRKLSQEIHTLVHDRQIDYMKWEQDEKERWVKEQLAGLAGTQTEFNTGLEAQLARITGMVTSIVNSMRSK